MNPELNIEFLIEQAEEAVKRWKPPRQEPRLTTRKWQEVLDGKTYTNVKYRGI